MIEAMPLAIDLPEHAVRVVHAGVLPGCPVEETACRAKRSLRCATIDDRGEWSAVARRRFPLGLGVRGASPRDLRRPQRARRDAALAPRDRARHRVRLRKPSDRAGPGRGESRCPKASQCATGRRAFPRGVRTTRRGSALTGSSPNPELGALEHPPHPRRRASGSSPPIVTGGSMAGGPVHVTYATARGRREPRRRADRRGPLVADEGAEPEGVAAGGGAPRFEPGVDVKAVEGEARREDRETCHYAVGA